MELWYIICLQIAQHYGIDTQYLDITDDLVVALFFACCRHVGNGKYRAITKKDLEDYGEYAVLYKKTDDLLMSPESAADINKVLPIGYQPFTRCYKQRGYFIDTMQSGDLDDLAADHGFKKLYFKRNPEFAAEIYELFNGGRELFYDRSMELLSELIDEIKAGDSFSNDSIFSRINSIKSLLSNEQFILLNRIIDKLKKIYELERDDNYPVVRPAVDELMELITIPVYPTFQYHLKQSKSVFDLLNENVIELYNILAPDDKAKIYSKDKILNRDGNVILEKEDELFRVYDS